MVPRPRLRSLGLLGSPAATALVTAAALAAQCADPPTPRAGFAYRYDRDQRIVLSDGYQTYANVIHPDAAPGACGWPLLVKVHGLGESRNAVTSDMIDLVRRGFLLVTYDVRGQGDARALNPGRGSRLWALDEWIDLAEIIDWATTSAKFRADATRVAVFGDSQGAVHAWAAAAYSGRALPANARRVKPYPSIKAVVPRYFSPWSHEVLVPQATSFLLQLTGFAYEASGPTVLLDGTFRTKLASYLDGADPAGLDAYLRQIPGKDFLAALSTTTVPTLAIAAWQDDWMSPNGVLAALAAMPKKTPKRLFLSTGKHGTPLNDGELLRQIHLTQSWLERFLKGNREPVELGPPILASLVPADRVAHADRTSLWRQRAEFAYPPPDVRPQRLHLRSLGRLTSEPAPRSEDSDVVENRVASGYQARSVFADGGALSRVLQSVPLSSLSYETTPLASDLELAGFPHLSLMLDPDTKTFLIGAQLVAVAPDHGEQVLATGAAALRLTSSSDVRIDFDLGAVSTVVPRGYALKLLVRNHDIQRPLEVDLLRRLPSFERWSVTVKHNSRAGQSWIEIPCRDRVLPDIASDAATISLTSPNSQSFVLRSAPSWQSAPYLVLLGLSGDGPPLLLPGGSRLWLVPDDATTGFLGIANSLPLQGFFGIVDAKGGGSCRLDFGRLPSLPVGLAGRFLQVCPLLWGSASTLTAGAPIRLRLE